MAVKPEIILLDEPCSALDPIATARIEELICELKDDYTIVLVTHNMQQAARVSDFTAFMYLNNSLFRELLTYMMEDPRNIPTCTHLLFCAKNIERMGDHATNIAESVYYIVQGAPIDGERPKGEAPDDRLSSLKA